MIFTKKFLMAFVALILSISCITTITTNAYSVSSGNVVKYFVNMKNYKCHNEIRIYDNNVTAACVAEPESGEFKGGEVGAIAYVYSSGGTLKATGTWEYCPSDCLKFSSPKTYYASSGSYYATGSVKIWVDSSSEYTTRTPSKSPNGTI